jgi:hypothetical protein
MAIGTAPTAPVSESDDVCGVWDSKVSVICRVRTAGRSTTPSAPISPDAVRSLSP